MSRTRKRKAAPGDVVDVELVDGPGGAIVPAAPQPLATASTVRILERHPVETLGAMLARPGVQAAHALAPLARFLQALLGPERRS